ncbi:MAG: winged helix-turn-helix transcriptional regulator [Alphaproteobacteria bacterium]
MDKFKPPGHRKAESVRDVLATRTVFAQVPPRVDYSLTGAGSELMPVLDQLDAWGAKQPARPYPT